jgi:hypothetical protein
MNAPQLQLYEVCQPPHRPSPPLRYHVDFIESCTVKQGQPDIYVDSDQKHLLLLPGDSATAHIRQPHRFANNHDEPVIFTIKTEPAGGVVKAFRWPTGLPTGGAAKMDGPRIEWRGRYFSRPPKATCLGFPRTLQRIAFGCAALAAKSTGLEKTWQVYFASLRRVF